MRTNTRMKNDLGVVVLRRISENSAEELEYQMSLEAKSGLPSSASKTLLSNSALNAAIPAKPKSTMKTLSSQIMPLATNDTPKGLRSPRELGKPKPPPKPSKFVVERALQAASSKVAKTPPATKPKPKTTSLTPTIDTALEKGKQKIADNLWSDFNNRNSQRSSKRLNRPKTKPPSPSEAMLPQKQVLATTSTEPPTPQTSETKPSFSSNKIEQSNDECAMAGKSTLAFQPQPQHSYSQCSATESSTTATTANKRVVRKPSVKPPPPPTSSSGLMVTDPENAQQIVMVRKCWVGPTNLEDMDVLPKLPSMPPPSPPKFENSSSTHTISGSNGGRKSSDDDGGEKFDELYEEIEQAFNEEQRSRSEEWKDEANSSEEIEKDYETKTEKYVPKYRKKIYGRFSPPDFYRSSIANSSVLTSNKDKNRHYDSLSIQGGDESFSSTKSNNGNKSGGTPKQSSMNPSYCTQSNRFGRWEEPARLSEGSGGYEYEEGEQDSADNCPADPNHAFSSISSHHQHHQQYLPTSTATFSTPRLRWRHSGRYDTWSSSANPKEAAMIRSVMEESSRNGTDSFESRPTPMFKHNFGGSVSRAKSTYNQKRKSLSELWRFKSELQLNLSKKMDQIRSKVNETVSGHSSAKNNSSIFHQVGGRSSMFYVPSTPCPTDHCTATYCCCPNANNSALLGGGELEHLDYWKEDQACIANQPPEDNEECIYGDDWSSSSSSDDGCDDDVCRDGNACPEESSNSSASNSTHIDFKNGQVNKTPNISQLSQKQKKQTPPPPSSSLLAEIESAYQELALKRRQKEQDIFPPDQPTKKMTSEEAVTQQQQCDCASATILPSSSGIALLSDDVHKKVEVDLVKLHDQTGDQLSKSDDGEDKATDLCAEHDYDKQRLQHPQVPTSSSTTTTTSNASGRILKRGSTIESSTESHCGSNNTGDPTTTSSSSCLGSREASLHPQESLAAAPAEGKDPAELGEEDAESAESLSLESRSLYTSRLPEPQPLYQIYMQQEQEKLLLEADPTNLGKKLPIQVPVVGKTLGPAAELEQATKAGLSVSAIPQTVPIPVIGLHEEHEADSVCDSCGNETDDIDPSVCIRRQSSSASTDSGRGADAISHITSSNTSMRRERLTAGSMCGSQRSLWCELAEVKSAGLLESLDEHSKKLQEAFFEVITSEASYLRSINILITSFMAAPELMGSKSVSSVITNAERKHLFSNIQAIRDASERLLSDLESRLKENLLLSDVCDILCEHFEKYFDSYVKYCSNQVYQDRTLKRLKAVNSQFMTCVQKIESDRQCQGLDMRSFLMLPMQRITRYPLLVYAILDRVDPSVHQHTLAARALILANQVVRNCNEGARRMERTEQLLDVERRMVYKAPDLKRIPLVNSGRYIVKSGTITQLLERRSKAKLNMLQSKQRARGIYLFLFSDLLLIAKKKLNGTFVCKDYAARRFIVTEPVEAHSHKVPPGTVQALTGKPHLFFCILMQNARGKQVELLLNAESESDRERWLAAMRPPSCANPDEKIYAEWDCPQAVAVHNYEAGQEDELNLQKGDVINILRKMPDGWFYGERTRDTAGGWFPSSYVQQILNDHVRANNYRARLKVIQAAADYRLQHHHPNHQPHRPMSSIGEKRASSFASTGSSSAIANGIANGTLSLSASSSSFCGGSTSQQLILNRLRRLSNPKAFFCTSNAPSPTAITPPHRSGE